MGAHHIIDTHSGEELAKAAGSFDFILSTVNAVWIGQPTSVRLGQKAE